jgi:hypothetical protein
MIACENEANGSCGGGGAAKRPSLGQAPSADALMRSAMAARYSAQLASSGGGGGGAAGLGAGAAATAAAAAAQRAQLPVPGRGGYLPGPGAAFSASQTAFFAQPRPAPRK